MNPKKKPSVKVKFPRKVVLGEGYPWAFGVGEPYQSIALCEAPVGIVYVPLNWPKALWSHATPKYRLILQRLPTRPLSAEKRGRSR